MFYIYPLVFPRGQTYAFAAEKAVNLYPFKTNRDLFFYLFRPRIPRRGLRRDSSYPGF